MELTENPRAPRPRRRLKLALVALLLLSLSVAAFVALPLVRRWRSTPERRGTPAGWHAVVSTHAGDGSPGVLDTATAPASARTARFHEPFGLAVAADGSLYVTDAGESNRVRKIGADGTVSTLAGGAEGHADGAGAAASFNTPSALALDRAGNLYVADTGNHRIRKVSPAGVVTTLAGTGEPGYSDGAAAEARFDAPVGVAVDAEGQVYVADTYNDRIRLITRDGQVRTIAGTGEAGDTDGDALTDARFDTPCALAVSDAGELYIADTGNNRLRKLARDGQVTTLLIRAPDGATPDEISRPVGLALTRDGFLYVTELNRGRVRQVAPDGTARLIAGIGTGFGNGDGRTQARFNQPAGVALAPDGSLYVADSANYLVRRLAHAAPQTANATPTQEESSEVLPRLDLEPLRAAPFPWPVDPQQGWHELVATMGEVRGTRDSDDSRHHLHSGLDVAGTDGQIVRAVYAEKISSPLPNWGFSTLNEGLRVGLFSYIHLRVGRDVKDALLEGAPFIAVFDTDGKLVRVRPRRGTRIHVGTPLGSINRMFHVHLNLGAPGAELNPLALPFARLSDTVAPVIVADGIRLYAESGEQLEERREGRLLVPQGARLRVVVEAYDRADGNRSTRRLGLYRLGYQLLQADAATPAQGFDEPRLTIEFDRLPPDIEAVKVAYAPDSGITVYGSAATRFLYEVTNTVRGGRALRGHLDTSTLPAGDYILRIFAADYFGNAAETGRDLDIRLAGG
ncbi:MAG TPA: NHL repeat-containing protein [Pyrinomonadaceae bacterium]|nr:NHL repeat-containing protein [Pyrinomonadaceae bacterium]